YSMGAASFSARSLLMFQLTPTHDRQSATRRIIHPDREHLVPLGRSASPLHLIRCFTVRMGFQDVYISSTLMARFSVCSESRASTWGSSDGSTKSLALLKTSCT